MGFLYPVGLAGAGAVEFIGATLAGAPTSGPITVNMPSEAKVGDLGVILVAGANIRPTVLVPPSGWLMTQTRDADGSNVLAFSKVLTSGDLTGVPVPSIPQQQYLALATLAYRGPVAAIIRAFGEGGGSPVAVGGITKRAQTAGLVAINWNSSANGYADVNLPADFTTRASKLEYQSTRSARIGDLLDVADYVNGTTFTFDGFQAGFTVSAVIELVGPLSTGSVENVSTIPAMTSNSAPAGYTATQDGQVGTSPGFNLYDATSLTSLGLPWYGADAAGTGTGSFPTWAERGYPAAIMVGAYAFRSSILRNWLLEGYVDGHWLALDQKVNATPPSVLTTYTIHRALWLPATKHRFTANATTGGRVVIDETFLFKGAE